MKRKLLDAAGVGWRVDDGCGSEDLRVAVFVDVPSLALCARSGKFSLDAGALLQVLDRFPKTVSVRTYLGGTRGPAAEMADLGITAMDEDLVELAIAGLGEGPEVDCGIADGKVDSQLVSDLLVAAFDDAADVFVIAGADPDYLPAIRVLKRLGKRAVLVAFPALEVFRFLGVVDEIRYIAPSARDRVEVGDDPLELGLPPWVGARLK
jgi:hypothetical protein